MELFMYIKPRTCPSVCLQDQDLKIGPPAIDIYDNAPIHFMGCRIETLENSFCHPSYLLSSFSGMLPLNIIANTYFTFQYLLSFRKQLLFFIATERTESSQLILETHPSLWGFPSEPRILKGREGNFKGQRVIWVWSQAALSCSLNVKIILDPLTVAHQENSDATKNPLS